ncbi:hypothetical protein ACG3SL_12915 [Sphingomonas sp. CJ20]
MLLPEARLDILLDELRGMAAADRNAVLARLSRRERHRVRKHLAAQSATRATEAAASPYSADIAARLAAQAGGLTVAGRRALDAFLAPAGQGPARGPSLAHAVGGLLRARGKLP